MQGLGFKLQLQKDAFINTKSRKSTTRSILSVAVCIIAAIIISLLVVLIIGNNPWTVFVDLFTKGFVDYKTLILNIAILGIGGLSFSFAFKAGVFNIGIPGQMMFAGLMLLVISKAIDDTGVQLPVGFGPILSLIIAITFGAVIAIIISLLKTFLNVNDVVSSILLNWILLFTVRLIIYKYYNPDPNVVFSQSIDIPSQFQLVAPNIGGWLPTLIVFAILVVGIYVIFKYTTYGHKILSVGRNTNASAYAGYNVRAVQMSTMAISGGIAGIMAVVIYTAGNSPSIPLTFDYDALPTQGFNGIAIGLIALNNPLAIVPVAFIMGLFTSSSVFLQISLAFSQLIMGLIILGAAMFVVLLNYHPWLWIKKMIYGFQIVNEYRLYENNMETLISKYRLQLSELKDKEQIDKLHSQYQIDKQNIKNEYLKQVLTIQAKNAFDPLLEAKNSWSTKNHVLQQQFIRYENRQNKKLQKLQYKRTRQFNNLVSCHNKPLRKMHGYLIDNASVKNQSLLDLLTRIYSQAQVSGKLLESLIQDSYNQAGKVASLQTKLTEYKKMISDQLEHGCAKACLDLLNKSICISDKVTLLDMIRKNFFFLSLMDKITLFFEYRKYYLDEKVPTNWDAAKCKQMLGNNVDKFVINDQKWSAYKTKFNSDYLLQINQLTQTDELIVNKEKVINIAIERSQKQLQTWMKNNEDKATKYYTWRSQLFGSRQTKYKRLSDRISGSKLDDKQKQELKKLLDNAYYQDQHSKGEN